MISKYIKNEFKFHFQSRIIFLGYIIGILINLIVYYFSSKVFVPNTLVTGEFLEYGYFEYIILGEICLIISQVSLNEGQDAFFRYKENGVVEQFYFSKDGLLSNLTNLYISLIAINFLHVMISIFFSKVFFSASFNHFQIIRMLFLQFFSGFSFIGLFYLNLSLSALMGRRNGSLQHLVNVLTFFSGAYFPLSILPVPFLRDILSASPFSLIVNFSRTFIYQGVVKWSLFFGLMGWLFITLLFSSLIFLYLKKKGIGRYVSP